METIQPKSLSPSVTAAVLEVKTGHANEVDTLVRRLDILEARLDELNNVLINFLSNKRLHRRRRRAHTQLMRFSQQAKKLAHCVPY
jgi:hypothetical protein